jgi:hypothetical protein
MSEKKPVFTPNMILVRNQTIFGTQVDDDLVMMDEDQGKYFGLNPVARAIWEYLEKPKSYETLLEYLTENYEIDTEKCNNDIQPFLSEMIANNLIKILGNEN